MQKISKILDMAIAVMWLTYLMPGLVVKKEFLVLSMVSLFVSRATQTDLR